MHIPDNLDWHKSGGLLPAIIQFLFDKEFFYSVHTGAHNRKPCFLVVE